MYYLGVDLGGTNIAVGLVSEEGKLLCSQNTPTFAERGYEAILNDIASLCEKVVAGYGASMSEVASVGIGSPGICNNDDGVIIYASNINFNDTPVREVIKKQLGLPVSIENDANCAAFGEFAAGAAKGYAHSITITLGTGVGGGIIIDGKIFSGSNYAGGEVGHQVIIVGGEQCSCGRKGCWEAYASATGLIREGKRAASSTDSKILSIAGSIENISAKTVFDTADAGDAVCKKIVADYYAYVAEGLANLINIFQPQIIVIGGGVAARGAELIDEIREQVRLLTYGGKMSVIIAGAELGNDAGIIGAAMFGKVGGK